MKTFFVSVILFFFIFPGFLTAQAPWDEVFLTYHPNGDYPYGSSQWFHRDAWIDANGVEVWKEVDNVLDSDADAIWFYPRNGQTIKAKMFKQNESRVMAPPANWEDAILILRVNQLS